MSNADEYFFHNTFLLGQKEVCLINVSDLKTVQSFWYSKMYAQPFISIEKISNMHVKLEFKIQISIVWSTSFSNETNNQ